jgi:hypothetical protein
MLGAKQHNCKRVYSRCFLWGPCRRFIGDSERRLQSVRAEKLWVKDTKPSRKGVVRIQLWSLNRHWRLYVLQLQSQLVTDTRDNILGAQIMKLIITQFYPYAFTLHKTNTEIMCFGKGAVLNVIKFGRNKGRFFSFLILYTYGMTYWARDQLVTTPLPTHRTTQTQ